MSENNNNQTTTIFPSVDIEAEKSKIDQAILECLGSVPRGTRLVAAEAVAKSLDNKSPIKEKIQVLLAHNAYLNGLAKLREKLDADLKQTRADVEAAQKPRGPRHGPL